MLFRLAYRFLTQVSPRLLWKAGHLWVFKGDRAMAAFRRRLKRGELFPPFLFLALSSACNLRCRGCWIDMPKAGKSLTEDDVERIIAAGERQKSFFYTLLGGEPMLYPGLWKIIEGHPECYFQIITNGMFFDEATVERLRAAGNVTPLVSVDGFEAANDARRGQGVFRKAVEGIEQLRRKKMLYGVATVVTGANLNETLTDEYVRYWIDRGAMYLWYYGYRPVGPDPGPELCLSREQMLEFRRRLLALRRRHPIILIDTYWDADGRAVCPASAGLGFHIGPSGAIEPCPPMSFARETVRDRDDLFDTINQSEYLRAFQKFATEKSHGCVILERPQELVEFLRNQGAFDSSGRDAYGELGASSPRSSHDVPGEEMPEDYWFYRLLKKKLFFGMGAYG